MASLCFAAPMVKQKSCFFPHSLLITFFFFSKEYHPEKLVSRHDKPCCVSDISFCFKLHVVHTTPIQLFSCHPKLLFLNLCFHVSTVNLGKHLREKRIYKSTYLMLLHFRVYKDRKTPHLRKHSICSDPLRFFFIFISSSRSGLFFCFLIYTLFMGLFAVIIGRTIFK